MAKKSKKDKTPGLKQFPSSKKAPRVEEPANVSSDRQKPVWNFHIADKEGPWAWKPDSSQDHWKIIFDKFPGFEGMNWSQIKQSGSHLIEISLLAKSAQQRLVEIKQDDLGQLFSLRISAKCRVWGILAGRVFKVLWYDPKHEVYPSTKGHT